MKNLQPIAIGDAQLIASNLVEQVPRALSATSYSTWSASTTYGAGAVVCHVFTASYGLIPGGTPNASGSVADRNLITGQLYFGIFTSKFSGNTNRRPGSYLYDEADGSAPGAQFWTLTTFAAAWEASATYALGATVGRVNGATGAFYQGLQAANLNHDPISASTWWRQTSADSAAEYSAGTTYAAGDRVGVTAGTAAGGVVAVYTSLQAGNLGNTPASSPSWWFYEGDTYKEWSAAASYVVGDRVVDLRTHHAYECAADHTNFDPTDEANVPAKWLDMGADNRWSMFDASSSSQSMKTGEIDVTVEPGALADTLVLLNCRMNKAWVSSRRAVGVNRNLLTKTQNFDDAAWTKQTNVSVAANAAAAPDGTETADRVTWTIAAVATGIYQSAGASIGLAYTKSVWVKAASAGDAGKTIELADPAFTDVIQVVTLTTAWQRVSLSETATVGNAGLWIRKTTTSPDTLDIWAGQLEQSSSMSGYQEVDAAYSGFEINYAQEFDLSDGSFVTSYRAYFFDPLRYKADLIVQDLPLASDSQVRVIASMPGEPAAIGMMAFGLVETLGVTLIGVSNGIRDYSRKEFDDWGNATFVERGFARIASMQVKIDPDQYDAVYNRLAELRATPTIWIGTAQFAGFWIHGISREFRNDIPVYRAPVLNLELEGIV